MSTILSPADDHQNKSIHTTSSAAIQFFCPIRISHCPDLTWHFLIWKTPAEHGCLALVCPVQRAVLCQPETCTVVFPVHSALSRKPFFTNCFRPQCHRNVPLRLVELLLAIEHETISLRVSGRASRRNLQRSMPLSCAGTPQPSETQGQHVHRLSP